MSSPTVKTAISLDGGLFRQAQGLARRLKVSPHVVIQNNLFNRSAISTVIACALTSNLKRASAPGNLLLGRGEADLPKKSVVNVGQVFTIDQAALVKRIGALSDDRVEQVLEGIRLLTEPRDIA